MILCLKLHQLINWSIFMFCLVPDLFLLPGTGGGRSMFNWLMMFWFMLRLLFCWFTKFRLLSFWLLLLLFRLLAMLATVLQMGNWFGLVKLILLLFGTIEERKPTERTPEGVFPSLDWQPENGDSHGEKSHLGKRHCAWVRCGRTLLPSWREFCGCFKVLQINHQEKTTAKLCLMCNHLDWISPPPPSRLMYITPCLPFTPASLFDLIFIWKRRWLMDLEEEKTLPSVFLSPLFSLSPPGLHPPPFHWSTPARVQINFCVKSLTFCQPMWFLRILLNMKCASEAAFL